LEIKMTDFDAFISSLANDKIEARTSAAPKPTYTCGQCGGTGLWSGGTNRHGNDKCLACKGVGHFVKSPADRQKAREASANRKAAAIQSTIDGIEAKYPGMIAYMRDIAGWNDFARDILGNIQRGFYVSDKALAAVSSMIVKIEATRAAKAAAAAANTKTVDLSRIREMFDAAVSNGAKKPIYRAEGLKISLAPANGRNAGALYVVEIEHDAYQGKIEGTSYKAVREAAAGTYDALLRIAADPMKAAVDFGRATGICACCGKELTNGISIELGIGPICRTKWGF